MSSAGRVLLLLIVSEVARLGATMLRAQQRRAEEKMIVEGAWILVVAGVVFAGVIIVVLVTSGKLYNPDRSHE
jgi:hypothetical protein